MEFKNEIDALVHLWEDGALNRRDLVKHLAKATGSVAAALATVQALNIPAHAELACAADVRVPEDAPDMDVTAVDFSGEAGTLFGYWARPKPMPQNPLPAVLVIHENAGLTPYIKDVTRRVARAGFLGVAIDLLSRQGGTAQFPEATQATAAYNRTTIEGRLADMISTLTWMKSLDYAAPNRMGVVGFCAGGGNVASLTVTTNLAAAVAFYPGSMPTVQQITDKLATPILFNVAELDTAVTNRVAAVIPTLLTARKKFALHVYDGTNHAFHNDTSPRYDPAAACNAWNLSMEFFTRFLNQVA